MFRLRKLGTRHLDIEITSDRNVDIRVVGRPGVWMDPVRLEQLLADMRTVVAESLAGKNLDYGVFADRKRLDRAIVTASRLLRVWRGICTIETRVPPSASPFLVARSPEATLDLEPSA